jgi:hypothetical protein
METKHLHLKVWYVTYEVILLLELVPYHIIMPIDLSWQFLTMIWKICFEEDI